MIPPPFVESPDPGTLLQGERRVLELIATGASLHVSLDTLCRVIDEASGLQSSIFLLDRAGERLHFAAGPHVPAVFRERVQSVPLTRTACGAAVVRREQVVVEEIASSPLFTEGYRDAAASAGFRAAWSTPFFSQHGRVLGTFAVYSPVVGPPSAGNLALVTRATHLASIAVERHTTEQELQESEVRFSRTFHANPASLSISSFATSRFTYVNDAFVRTFGHSRSEAVGRTALELGLYADAAEHTRVMALLRDHQARELEVNARTKAGAIRPILLSLERVEVLGEESVLGIAVDITARKHAEEALQRSETRLRLVLDAIPVGVIVTDPAGNVLLSNPSVARIWGKVTVSGPERYALSKGWWHDSGRRIEPDEWASVRARLKGETSLNEVIDIDTFDGERKTIQNSACPVRDADGTIVGAVVVNEDISARKAAEDAVEASAFQLRALAQRLMRAQDDERRRIAQLLHDTTAQELAALKMLLARIARTTPTLTETDRALLGESVDIAERSMSGVRTLSYLLYPPFLDENGLTAAVRWYAKGFADRSGVAVELDLPPTFERLPRDVETALFRVVQEALINIHRHAQSATARIRLRTDADRLTLDIEDRGRGMSSETLSQVSTGAAAFGVGIAGMRERLEQLGGTLEIQSGDHGTIIRAIVPLRDGSA